MAKDFFKFCLSCKILPNLVTLLLTSCLTGLDLTKQVKLLLIQHKQWS